MAAISSASAGKAIDEDLYSRQLLVMGMDAMRRMTTSRVLVCGLNGVGVEVAKNVILAGVKAVHLCDTGAATSADLSGNFYLSPEHVASGQSRADACVSKLRELNANVEVDVLASSLIEELEGADSVSADAAKVFSAYSCVVMCDKSRDVLEKVGKHCHASGICLIATGTYGLYGYTFSDFGPSWTVADTDGEQARQGVVESVSRDAEGAIVSGDSDEPHGLSTGDLVEFVGVEGMTELNRAGDVSGAGAGAAAAAAAAASTTTFEVERISGEQHKFRLKYVSCPLLSSPLLSSPLLSSPLVSSRLVSVR